MPPAMKKGPGGGRGRRRGAASSAHGDEGSERWLVTYADMLTVLLALFIVLFAISALNEAKFEQLKHSLAAAFGEGSTGMLDGDVALNDSDPERLNQLPNVPLSPITNDQDLPITNPRDSLLDTNNSSDGRSDADADTDTDTEEAGQAEDGSKDIDGAITVELDNFQEIEEAINASLAAAGMSGAVEFAVDRRGLIITVVTDALVFPGNSATLLPKGETLLGVITPPLTKVANTIEVDGFTNQEDVSTFPYPSGWELSSARASTVVRYLESHGLEDRPLSAVGYSDQRPLVSPDDPLSITRNRRVEIIVLSSLPATAADALQLQAEARGMTTTDGASDSAAAGGSGSGGSAPQGPAS